MNERMFISNDSKNGEVGVIFSESEAIELYMISFNYLKEDALNAFLDSNVDELEDEITVDGEKYLITLPMYGNFNGLRGCGYIATGYKNLDGKTSYEIEWEILDGEDLDSVDWNKPSKLEDMSYKPIIQYVEPPFIELCELAADQKNYPVQYIKNPPNEI